MWRAGLKPNILVYKEGSISGIMFIFIVPMYSSIPCAELVLQKHISNSCINVKYIIYEGKNQYAQIIPKYIISNFQTHAFLNQNNKM